MPENSRYSLEDTEIPPRDREWDFHHRDWLRDRCPSRSGKLNSVVVAQEASECQLDFLLERIV